MTSLDNISVEGARIGAHPSEFSVEHVSLEMLRHGAEAMTFANGGEFTQNGLETVEVLCRIYPSPAFDVPVIVPERYAAQLDEVRELRRQLAADITDDSVSLRRLLVHPLCNRALPEDIFPVVAALPTKHTLSRVVLRDDWNPCDVFYKTLYGDDFRSGADVTTWGEVTLYRRDIDRYLAEAMFHEWVHTATITDRGAGRQMQRLFEMSRAIEPHGDHSRAYARHAQETLAVNLGEQIMGWSGSAALEFAVGAPVRAAVLSRGLRQMLQAGLEMHEPSSLMDPFIRRLDVLDQETSSAARRRLIETANGSSDAKTAHDAALLLAFVGSPADMANLTKTAALDVSCIPVDAGVIDRIRSMPALRRLDLSRTDLDGDRLGDLTMLPLEALAVAGLKLMNYHMVPLFHIKSLRSLDITATCVNDGAVEILSRMALRALDTRRSNMTDEGRGRLRDLLPEAVVE